MEGIPLLTNYMLTNDGSTLLSVRCAEDGALELLSTPVTILEDPVEQACLLPAGNIIELQGDLPKNAQLLPVAVTQDASTKPQGIESDKSTNSQLSVDEQTITKRKAKDASDESLVSSTHNKVVCEKERDGHGLSPKKPIVSSKRKSSTPRKIARKSLGKLKRQDKNFDKEKACYTCSICGQEFKKHYVMQKHINEHAKDKPHHCPKCPAAFNVPTNFRLHMATHSSGEPRCPECGRKFARIASLKTHMSIHELDESLYCIECDDAFETQAQLDAHIKLHTVKCNSEDYRRCKLCRKEFIQPAIYRQHLRDHYKLQTKCMRLTKRGLVSSTIHQCRICLKSFTKSSVLIRHLRIHTGEKPFKCNVCERSFSQKSSVRIHMWQHKGFKPYECKLCPAKFTQKGNLTSHVERLHTVKEGMTVYRCTHCLCIFEKLCSLNSHISRIHSGDDLRCDNNLDKQPISGTKKPENRDKSSDLVEVNSKNSEQSTNQELTESRTDVPKGGNDAKIIKIEEGFVPLDETGKTAMVTLVDKSTDKTKKKYIKLKQMFINRYRFYECNFCSKRFRKPSDLVRHIRVHTLERPYKCKICKRGFKLRAHMLVHQKTHESEGKTCPHCSKWFRSETAYTQHTKTKCASTMCGLCGEKFSSFDELKIHSEKHLPPRRSRKSKVAIAPEAKDLASKIVLKQPLVLTQTDDGNMKVQSKYENEIARGKGRPHKCENCPAAFMKLSHLKQHLRKHTGERPFECDICDRNFPSKSAVKTHLRTHDSQKPYECHLCGMTFSFLSSKNRHLTTHTDLRPFMCPYCNKTFKTHVNCTKHMKTHKDEVAQQQWERENARKTLASTIDSIPIISIPEPIFISDLGAAVQPFTINTSQNGRTNFSLSITDGNQSATQNLPLVHNHSTFATQTPNAAETGTVTLPNFPGDQTITSDNLKQIEETLNQQLLSIGMNLTLEGNIKSAGGQINANNALQNQSTLSIIYGDGTTLESHINASIHPSVSSAPSDGFNINQITLQGLNGLTMGMAQPSSANMTIALPGSNPQFLNSQECLITEPSSIGVNNLACQLCKKQNFTAESLKEHVQEHTSDGGFECIRCSLNFSSSDGLHRHLKVHESEETHKCYECKREFPTSLLLREHIKDHVKSEMKLKSTMGINVIDDIEPKKADISAKKNAHECQYCSKTFRKPSDLVRHVRTHTGEKPYQCQICSKTFAVKCSLDCHVKTHMNQKSYHCHVCDAVLTTKGSLKTHMSIHSGDKPLKCTMCNLTFRTSEQRNIHLKTHQSNNGPTNAKVITSEKTVKPGQVVQVVLQNPDSCVVASDELVDPKFTANGDNTSTIVVDENNQLMANLKYLLENGLVTIQTETVSSSDTSNMEVTSSESLENGLVTIQSMETVPFTNTSNVNFTSSDSPKEPSSTSGNEQTDAVIEEIVGAPMNSSLVEEESRTNSNSNEQAEIVETSEALVSSSTKHLCNVCGRGFAKPCLLERHRRIHTGERPFKCDKCAKAFTQKSTLQLHQRYHNGDRPHACPECEKSYTQSANLHAHIRRIHKLDPHEAISAKRNALVAQHQFINFDPRLLGLEEVPIDLIASLSPFATNGDTAS